MYLQKFNFLQKLDSRTCSPQACPAPGNERIALMFASISAPQSLLIQAQDWNKTACWYSYLYVSTMYLTSLRHTVCSHSENLTHQKMTLTTYIHNHFFVASTDPTLSIRIIHLQRKRKRHESWWSNLMHPFQAARGVASGVLTGAAPPVKPRPSGLTSRGGTAGASTGGTGASAER